MNTMDLNEILIFAKVVQLGSFSAAAKTLELPKSTVSTKIRKLETRLGVSLLTRTTRQLRVTEAGQSYYERCARALEGIQSAEAEASQSQNQALGRIRVTAPVEMGNFQLTSLLERFTGLHPAIQIEMILTDEVIDLVRDGVDLAIRAGTLEDSSLRARKLGESSFQLFAAPKYLKRSTPLKKLEDLEKHPCLLFSITSTNGEWILRRGSERKKVSVSGPILSNHLIQLRDLAVLGAGVALLPSFLCEEEVRKGTLVRVLADWYSEKSPVHVVYPAREFTPPKVARFIEFLRNEFTLPRVE